MNYKNSILVGAVATALVGLAGCGGGGGGGGSNNTTQPSSTTVDVAPSLGKFRQGAPVVIKGADGQQRGTGTVGANGRASVSIGTYQGPMVVEVQGGTGVTYFDEGTGADANFPAGRVLRAMSPSVSSSIAVTALTNAAAEKTTTVDAPTITKNNLAIAQQFGLANILAAPVVVDTSTKVAAADGDAGNYALILAAIAKAAQASNTSLDQVVAALATDLKDGVLDGKNGADPVTNTVTPAAINAGKAGAITGYAATDSTTYFQSSVADVAAATPTPTPEQIAAAGSTDLAQAKALFANLKAGILPYATEAKTGFINTQGDKMQAEVNALSGYSSKSLDLIGKIAKAVDATGRGAALPSECIIANNNPPAQNGTPLCYYQEDTGGYVAADIVMSDASHGTWTALKLDATRTSVTSSPVTGTLTYVGGVVTMNGYLPSSGTNLTKVGVGSAIDTDLASEKAMSISRTNVSGTIYKYTFEGTATEVDSTKKPFAQLVLDAGSYVVTDDTNTDKSQDSANLSGSFLTANYTLLGKLALSNLKTATETYTEICGYQDNGNGNWTPVYCNGSNTVFVGGTVGFTGTVNGVGLADTDSTNDFDILVGKLDATATPTTGYNPNAATSATNMITGTTTFTGTVKRSATDAGISLIVNAAVTGATTGTLTVTYKDATKSINLTGSGSYDSTKTGQTLDLASSDGIAIHFVQDATDATIVKGATQLGTVTRTGRINFIDGTSTSLM